MNTIFVRSTSFYFYIIRVSRSDLVHPNSRHYSGVGFYLFGEPKTHETRKMTTGVFSKETLFPSMVYPFVGPVPYVVFT